MMDKFSIKEPIRFSDVSAELNLKIFNALSPYKKLKLKIVGSVYIGNFQMEGWSEKMPFYLFRCSVHGLEVGYPSGYAMNLICLDCLKEQLKEIPDPVKLLKNLYPSEDKVEEEKIVQALPVVS